VTKIDKFVFSFFLGQLTPSLRVFVSYVFLIILIERFCCWDDWSFGFCKAI